MSTRAGSIVFATAVLAAFPFMGMAQTPASTQSGIAGGKHGYSLGPGDQVVIRALNVPEISDKQSRIDPDGNLNIPMIGRIHAAGLTVVQLEAEMFSRLKVYLNEPQVSVEVSEYRSQPVSILGEVGTPGVHQLEGRKTLVEILALAGGVKAEAGPTIRIARRLEFGTIPIEGATVDPSGKFSIADVALRPLIDSVVPENDILIQPYDVISVPRAELIYIGGEVAKAGPVALTDAHNISILQALSSTGGVLKTAAPNKARILRSVNGKTTRDQISVDVAKIMDGQAEDAQLQPGDILYIPSSIKSKATARALEAVIQAGTVILTYGIIH